MSRPMVAMLTVTGAVTLLATSAAVWHSGAITHRETARGIEPSPSIASPLSTIETREGFTVETLPPIVAGTVGQPLLLRARQVLDGTPPFRRSLAGPPDATLSPNGSISILPRSPGMSGPYTLSVTDARGRTVSTQTHVEVSPPLFLEGGVDSWGTVGKPYESRLTVKGGRVPYAWSFSGTLPPGLSFVNGKVSGTPTQSGRFDGMVVTVLDADNRQSFTGAISIDIAGPMNVEPMPARVSAVVSRPQLIPAVAVLGGTPPFRRTLTGPEGATLRADGSIEVSPRRPGSHGPYTLTVTDGRGQTASTRTTVEAFQPMTVVASPPPILVVGVESSIPAPTLLGGVEPFIYSLRSPTGNEAPPGMVFLPSHGVIAGTPSRAGTFGPYRVEVKDSTGAVQTSEPFEVPVALAQDDFESQREVIVDGVRCNGIKGWDCVHSGNIRTVEFRYPTPRRLSQAAFGCDYVTTPSGLWESWNGQQWLAVDMISEAPCTARFRQVGATAVRFTTSGQPLRRVWTPRTQTAP